MDNYLMNWNRYYSAYGGPAQTPGAQCGPSPRMGFGPGLGFGQQFGPGMTPDFMQVQGFGQNFRMAYGRGFTPGTVIEYGHERIGQAEGFRPNFVQGSAQQLAQEMFLGPSIISAVTAFPAAASSSGTCAVGSSGNSNLIQTASQNNLSLPQDTNTRQQSMNSVSVKMTKCSNIKTGRVDKQCSKKKSSESGIDKLKASGNKLGSSGNKLGSNGNKPESSGNKLESSGNSSGERQKAPKSNKYPLQKKSEIVDIAAGNNVSAKPDKESDKIQKESSACYIDNKQDMVNKLNTYQNKDNLTKGFNDNWGDTDLNGTTETEGGDNMSVYSCDNDHNAYSPGSGLKMKVNHSARKRDKDGQECDTNDKTPSPFQSALAKALNALAGGKCGSSIAEQTNVNLPSSNVVRSLTFTETSKSKLTSSRVLETRYKNTTLLQKKPSGEVSEKPKLEIKKGSDDVIEIISSDSDEDPEYVQSQLYIGNLAVNTSQKEILQLLKEYKVQQVWIAYHKSKRDDICAFVKVATLKETRRIVKEMEEAFLRGKFLTVRFAAAKDFDDYNIKKPRAHVSKDKQKQSQSETASSSTRCIVPVHTSSSIQTLATVHTIATTSTQSLADKRMDNPTAQGLLPAETHGTFQTGTSSAPHLPPALQSLVSTLYQKPSENAADVTCKVSSAQLRHQPATFHTAPNQVSTASSHRSNSYITSSPAGQFSGLPLAAKQEKSLATSEIHVSTKLQCETVSINPSSSDMQSLAALTLELSSKVKSATAVARNKLNEQYSHKISSSSNEQPQLPEKDLVEESRSVEMHQKSKFVQYVHAVCPNASLLGLKYITEYIGPSGNVQYICGLCRGLFQGSDIASHIVSFHHRMNYFYEEYSSVSKELMEKRQTMTDAEIARECDQYALKYTAENDCISTVCHELVDRYVQLDLASVQNAGLKELREKQASLVKKIHGTMSIGTALESKIDHLIQQAVTDNTENKAVIGLKFITEIIEREPGVVTYTCSCCGVSVSEAAIGGHILGITHRLKYFEIERSDDIVNRIETSGLKRHRELLEVSLREAEAVEAEEGRCQVLTISKAQQILLEARYGLLIDQYKPSQKITGVGKQADRSSSDLRVQYGTGKQFDVSSSCLPVWCGTRKHWQPDIALAPFLEDQQVLKVAKRIQLEEGKDCVQYYRYLATEYRLDEACAGLKHVTEIQKADSEGLYGYYCRLCKFTGKTPAAIHQHVCGYQHVINYLEQDHPYIYGKVMLEYEEQVKKKMADFHVRELRQTEGIEAINAVIVRLKDVHKGNKVKSVMVAQDKKQPDVSKTPDQHQAPLISPKLLNNLKGFQKHAEEAKGSKKDQEDTSVLRNEHRTIGSDQKPPNLEHIPQKAAQKHTNPSQVLQCQVLQSQVLQSQVLQSQVLQSQLHQHQTPQVHQISSQVLQSQVLQNQLQQHQTPQVHQISSQVLQSQVLQNQLQKHQKPQVHHESSQVHQNQPEKHQKASQILQNPLQKCQKPTQELQNLLQKPEKPEICSQVLNNPSQKQEKLQKPFQVQQKPQKIHEKPSEIPQKPSQICQQVQLHEKHQKKQKQLEMHQKESVSATEAHWKPDLDSINIYKLLKIECSDTPVIGLQYVHETIDKTLEDPISYQCKLCCLTFTIATVCKHLTSFVHRFKYLEKNYPELCEQIKRCPLLLEKYCCWIDATYGREDCVLRKVLVKDTKDGRPVYTEVKSVTDLEYTSPWKNMYSLEKLKLMSDTVQSKSTEPAVAEQEINKAGVKEIMKDIEDKKADINKRSHGARENADKMRTNAESTTAAASGETYIWKKEYEKLRERICNQNIVKCQRRSKFLTTYGDQTGKIALLGLKEITEFQLPDVNARPWYLCFLCERRLCSTTIFDHVTSREHRLQYMKSNYQYLYDLVTSNNPITMTVEGLAREIASTEGDVREMEVMMELNVDTEAQKSTIEVKGNMSSSSSQEVDRGNCDLKRLRSSDGPAKMARPVLKESDKQNVEKIDKKENLSIEKGGNKSECNLQRVRPVSGPGGSGCNREAQRKTHRSGPVRNCGNNDPLKKSGNPHQNMNMCQGDYQYGKRLPDSKVSRGKEGAYRPVQNVHTKRTLERGSGSQENFEQHETDSPKKKRIRNQAMSAVDLNQKQSSDKGPYMTPDRNDTDSVKEEKKHNTLQQLIDEWPHTSMIGLDHICEIKHSVREDFPPLYRCDICSDTDNRYLTAREMLFHVCSRNHRESFFKNVRKDLFEEIQSNATDQISFNALLDQYAKLYQDKSSVCFHAETVDHELPWHHSQPPAKKVSPSAVSSTVVQMKSGLSAVKISYYVSPSEIHLQLADTDKTAVNELMKNMQEAYRNSVHGSKIEWKEGMYCAAFLVSEKLWYRGKITKSATPGQGFEVFLIDYGSTHKVSGHNLRGVLKQFRAIACLSFCSRLHNLKPANSLVEWPLSTNALVKDVLQRRKLFLEKKARVKDGKLPVDLLIESEDKQSGMKKYRSLCLILQREGVAVKEGMDNFSAKLKSTRRMPIKIEVKSEPAFVDESVSVQIGEKRKKFNPVYSNDTTTDDFQYQENLSGSKPNAELTLPASENLSSQECFEYNHGFADYNSSLEHIEPSSVDCFGLEDNASFRADIFSSEHHQEQLEVHTEPCISEDLIPHIDSDIDCQQTFSEFLHDPFQPKERVETTRFSGYNQSEYRDIGLRQPCFDSNDYEQFMEEDNTQMLMKSKQMSPVKSSFSARHRSHVVQQDQLVGQDFHDSAESSVSLLKSLHSLDYGAAHTDSGVLLPNTKQECEIRHQDRRSKKRDRHSKESQIRKRSEFHSPTRIHNINMNTGKALIKGQVGKIVKNWQFSMATEKKIKDSCATLMPQNKKWTHMQNNCINTGNTLKKGPVGKTVKNQQFSMATEKKSKESSATVMPQNKKRKRNRRRNRKQINQEEGGLLHGGINANAEYVDKAKLAQSTKEVAVQECCEVSSSGISDELYVDIVIDKISNERNKNETICEDYSDKNIDIKVAVSSEYNELKTSNEENASGIPASIWERLNASDEDDIDLSESELRELEASINSQLDSDVSDLE